MNKITRKLIAIFLVTVNIVLFSNSIANSQQLSTPSNNQCLIDPSLNLAVTQVQLAEGSSGNKINMGDRIDVGIKILQNEQSITLNSAIQQGLITPQKLILHINDYPLSGLTPQAFDNNQLRFQLIRTEESLDAWNAILGGSLKFQPRSIAVSVGCPESIAIESKIQPIELYLRTGISGSFLFLFGLLLWLFLRFSRDSIRDDSQVPSFSYNTSEDNEIPYKSRGISSIANQLIGKRYKNKPPFSLGRTQMAWWFFIVTGSFMFILARTGDFTNIMNSQALILIGISAGTGVGAVFIDDGKNSSLAHKVDKLETGIQSLEKKSNLSSTETVSLQKQKEELKKVQSAIPKSCGFIKDLLNNKNSVSFHRYQIFVWTIILGIIFLIEVVSNLKFPEFDSTLLTLQGISAGTYLGFKLPENSKAIEDSVPELTPNTNIEDSGAELPSDLNK